MSRREMTHELELVRKVSRKNSKQVTRLRESLLRARQQGKTTMRDCLASGNMRGVVSALQHMRKVEMDNNTTTEGCGKAETCPLKTATHVATDILIAVCRKLEGKSNKGNRLSEWTKALLSCVRHQHGEVGMNLWTRNLLIGSNTTAKRAVMRPKVPFMAQLKETD